MTVLELLTGNGNGSEAVAATLPPPPRRALPPPVNPWPKPPEEKRPVPPTPAALKAGLAARAAEVAAKFGVQLGRVEIEARSHASPTARPVIGKITGKLLLRAAKEIEREIATASEVEALKELADEWDHDQKQMLIVAPTSQRVHDLLEEDARNAGTKKFKGFDVDSVRQRCFAELRPLKDQLRATSAKAAQISGAIQSRVLEALSHRIGQLLETEIATAAELEMPYVPSVYLATLWRAHEIVGGFTLEENGDCNPRDFLLGLVGLLLDEQEAKK